MFKLLKKEYLTNETKKDLTFKKYVYSTTNGEAEIEFLKFYKNFEHENEKYYIVPPFIQNIFTIDPKDIFGDLYVSDEYEYKSTIEYRDELQKEASEFLMNTDYGLLSLPPGKGKTIISLHAMAQTKGRTLIIVDQKDLLKQWKSRIDEFIHVPGGVTIFDSKVGLYKGQVVIATVQALIRYLDEDVLKNILLNIKEIPFETIIVDEIHSIVGTEIFGSVLFYLPSKRIWGLTATPYRTDKRDILIKYWLSENNFTYSEYDIKPKIKFMYFSPKFEWKDKMYIYSTFKGMEGGKAIYENRYNRMNYMKKLSKTDKYKNIIQKIVESAFEKSKNMLVLSYTKKALKEIKKSFWNINRKIHKQIAIFMEKNTTKEAEEKLITFATTNKAQKGIDIPKWEVVVFASPINGNSPEHIQAIGRVCRRFEGKNEAFVIDLVDVETAHSIYFYGTRLKKYLEEGFEILNKKIYMPLELFDNALKNKKLVSHEKDVYGRIIHINKEVENLLNKRRVL